MNMPPPKRTLGQKATKDLPPPEVNVMDDLPKEAFQDKRNKFKVLVERQMQQTANLTVKERVDNFINETSFTAITKVVKANTIIKKIIWLVALIAMMVWLGVQIYWLFEKYFKHPVEVKIELKAATKLEFPSVTVCNRNPLKSSQLDSSSFSDLKDYFTLTPDTSLYDKAMERFQNSQTTTSTTNNPNLTSMLAGAPGTSSAPTDWRSLAKQSGFNMWDGLQDKDMSESYYKSMDAECAAATKYASEAQKLDADEIEQYGHQKNDMITSCKFSSYKCSPANFTYLHNSKYGNCYTFNSYTNPTSEYTTYAGPLMGLTIEFNIQQDEYISALAADAGIRVTIHDRSAFPFPEDDGFTIAPGFATSVALKKIHLTRLEPPHANCSKSPGIVDNFMKKYGTTYSKRTCMKSCYQQKLLDICGCACPYFLVPSNATVCDFADENVSDCATSAMENWSQCESVCPTECDENKYEVTTSMSKWPSDNYNRYLQERMQMTTSDFMDSYESSKRDTNLVKLEVYFQEMSYENIEMQKAYESQNLISDVGGQLGLWLGLSAITFGELVEFFMAIFRICTARFIKKKKSGIDHSPIQVFRG